MKRTISLVLCLTLILGLLTGVAAGENGNEPVRVDMTQTAPDGVEFGDTFDLEFEYNGKVYYLGLANPNGPFVEVASGGYPFLYETVLFVTGYYYQVEELTGKQVPLSDQEPDLTLAESLTAYLEEKYGKLSICLYPTETKTDAVGPTMIVPEPSEVEERRFAARALYGFDLGTDGNFILTLENSSGDVLSCGWLEMDGTPGTVAPVSTLADAQAVLNRYENYSERVSVTLLVSATELEGQLKVPKIPGIVSIRSTANDGTVLKGGIEIVGGTTVGITNFHFQGKGDGVEKLSDGTPNSALYGTTGANLWNCSIEDYYYGVLVDRSNTMMNFGGNNVVFEDNHVGIYVDYDSQYAGLAALIDYQFIENDTAIYIENWNIGALGKKGMNALSLEGGIFINNTVDVENNDEEVLWMPMCYFVHGDENAHKHSDKQSAHWQPVIKPTAKKHQVPAVIASPAACAPSCLVSDGYYYPKHIYVSDDIRELYPIDALESDMAVTAVDDSNKAIATVELTSTAPAVNPTAAQAGTYSLRRLAAPMLLADEETTAAFDSVMEKSETDSKITLTIGAMPEGYAGTVTVECGSDLAYVYHEGKLIASTLSDGYVSFAAVQSTKRETYEIKKVDASDDGIVIPQTPAKKDESEPSVDVTEVYSDVAADDWFCDAVEFVTEQGLMNGMGEGSFAPGENLSRAMMWTMLARLDGADTEGGENWYDKGLAWAKANGVSDGSAPNGSITREQLVTMLWRFEGEPKADLKVLDGYADADKLSDYARQAMAWAVSKGVIRGQGDDILAPVGQATRAEVAQIFYNYLAKLTAAGGKRDAL